MDRRDLASRMRWWEATDGYKATMRGYGQEDEDGNPIFEAIPVVMIICPTCEGRGEYVNPNIDRQGLSREDFDEQDDEFRVDYFSGNYNVRCDHCHGSNVIPWPTEPGHIKMGEEHIGMILEWEAESEAERRMGA